VDASRDEAGKLRLGDWESCAKPIYDRDRRKEVAVAELCGPKPRAAQSAEDAQALEGRT
ncbi:unnamed protein product, partial [Amoebophrya sp. A25]